MSTPTREQLVQHAIDGLRLVAQPELDTAAALVERLVTTWLTARARYPRLVRHAPADIAATFEALDAFVDLVGTPTTEETT